MKGTSMDRTKLLTRRGACRLLIPLAVALMVVLQVQSASAAIGWCRTDPLITVNGRTGHVYIESSEAMLSSTTGPILVEVRVPVGSVAAAIPLDNGFGRGYTITFVEDPRQFVRGSYSEVRVAVYVPAVDGSLPVKVTFHADSPSLAESNKSGTANNWILTGEVKI
jgi:hypothetical protein